MRDLRRADWYRSAAPGQNVGNPPGNFFNHFIVERNGLYYDPSYGNGPFLGQNDWENGSLDGYAGGCQGGGIAFKNNDPAVLEMDFIFLTE